MKLLVPKGTTSKITHVFVQDSTSTTGAGKTGLTNASVTCYYIRPGATGATASTVNSITTLGTFAGSATNCAFKEVDATNLPGVYEFHFANDMLAAGVDSVSLLLKGSGLAPVPLEVQLVDPMFLPGASQVIEDQPSTTIQQALSLILAAVAGRTSDSGNTFASPNNGETRLTVTTDVNNNRTAVTLAPATV